jgi:hypothetical protein
MAAHEWWSAGVTLKLITDRAELKQLDVPDSVPAAVIVKSAKGEQILNVEAFEMLVDWYRSHKADT